MPKFQLTEDELREAHVLVFANKQDLPNAMTASELTDQLGLQSLRNRKVRITLLNRAVKMAMLFTSKNSEIIFSNLF